MPSFLGHPRATRILVPAPIYATWNPAGTNPNITLSNGNLTAEVTGASAATAYGATGVGGYNFDDGKRYIEIQIGNFTNTAAEISMGFKDTDQSPSGELGNGAHAYAWRADGSKVSNGSASTLGTPAAAGDVVMMAIHAYLDGGSARARIWYGKNGTWFNNGDPATGFTPAFDGVSAPLASDWNFAATMKATGDRVTLNSGGHVFSYAVPTGFDAGWG